MSNGWMKFLKPKVHPSISCAWNVHLPPVISFRNPRKKDYDVGPTYFNRPSSCKSAKGYTQDLILLNFYFWNISKMPLRRCFQVDFKKVKYLSFGLLLHVKRVDEVLETQTSSVHILCMQRQFATCHITPES